jgi:hypothetical protein
VRIAALLLLLSLGCAGVVARGPHYEVIITEWFRSGCYIVSAEGVAMETNPMSPVLGGAVLGGAVAGAGGAGVGAGVGFLEEAMRFFGGDADALVYGCGLVESEDD